MDFSIKNSNSENLLGVSIDSKLNFDSHINHLCSKGSKKPKAFARVTPSTASEERKLSWNHFNSQFNYCPLIWLLYSLHSLLERILRLIDSDKKLSNENLLVEDNPVCMHHQNTQILAIEMLKVKHKVCLEITSNTFIKSACAYKTYWGMVKKLRQQ